MKPNDLLLLGGAALAVVLLGKKSTSGSSKPWVPPQAVSVAVPNGWQYFTDGTAISPDGTYYFQGQAVWWPTM